MKDCAMAAGQGCFSGEMLKYLNGSNWIIVDNRTDYYKFITSDGLSYFYYRDDRTATEGRIGYFNVDVNGPRKGPNILGRDNFAFQVFPSSLGIKPDGAYHATNSNVVSSTDINANCNPSGGNGWYCAAKVLAEGGMSY